MVNNTAYYKVRLLSPTRLDHADCQVLGIGKDANEAEIKKVS